MTMEAGCNKGQLDFFPVLFSLILLRHFLPGFRVYEEDCITKNNKMDISAKNKFETHYEILRKYYGVDKVPFYNGLKDFSKDEYINRCGNDGFVLRNFSDDDFEMLKTLAAFFDQRDKMTCKEFSNTLIAEYGVALSIEKDVLEIEKFNVLSNLGANVKTMKRIMVFFFVLGTISIIGIFLGALMYFLA